VAELVLLVAACVLFLGSTFRANRHLWAAVALLGLAGAALALWLAPVPTLESRQAALSQMPAGPERQESLKALEADVFAAPLVSNRLALFVKVLALVAGVVLVLFSWNEVSDRLAGEYHACLLLIVAGLSLVGSANELVMLFLALELISIPSYVLLYLGRTDTIAQEAAMKYFLLSVFSSALLLFGFSYLYGLAGTTNLSALIDALNRPQEEAGRDESLPATAQVALVMVLTGLGARLTIVPFHFYAPDVYQGTSPATAALLALMPKAAGFVALLRVLGFVPADLTLLKSPVAPGLALGSQVPILLWILAALTMSVGNVLALWQDNVKRLLAYSSVAHAGYMLIGLAVAPYLVGTTRKFIGGTEAVLFYLVAYGAMTVGAFAVIAYLSTPQRPVETVDDLAGLSSSHPGIALLMVVFLFSLIGMPSTAGFVGKVLLFAGPMQVPVETGSVAWEERARLFRILALIGVLNAAVGAWYYLRIIAVMYLRTALRPIEKERAWPGLAALGVCAAVTLAVGIYPNPMFHQADQAVPQAVGRAAVQGGGGEEAAPTQDRGILLPASPGVAQP
jgi:NADH-quinone oxidoreductase subunit N